MPRVTLTQPHSGRSISVDAASADQWRARGYSDAAPASPAPTALKAEWVDYAVGQGMTRDDAEAMTKADLVERFQ